MPLVSVIIPVYNSQRFLAKAIDSALAQEEVETEVIVVNDGSTDGSLAVAHGYASKGVRVLDTPNAGASAARNKGLAIANGDWIQFLDADDFLRPDKVKSQLTALTSSNEIATCNTIHFHADDASDGVVTDNAYLGKYGDDPLRFLIHLYGGFGGGSSMVQPNAYLFHRDIIEKAGKWDESLSLDDDGEFFCRVVLAAERIRYVPQPMNFYRKYKASGSLSAAKGERAYKSQFESIRLRHLHLLKAASDPGLIRNINTATYKQLRLLMFSLFPNNKPLLNEVTNYAGSLRNNAELGPEVYGGRVANFIGNRVSWKLLRRLQLLKANNSIAP